MSTPNDIRRFRPVDWARWLTIGLAALAVIAAISAGRASAAPGVPVGLPGPPPLAMADYPTPPVAGVVPPAGPAGPPATVPTRLDGPGLRNGVVRADGRQLTIQIACSSDGKISVAATAIAADALARGAYTCKNRRATAQLKLTTAAAHELRLLKSTLGRVTLRTGKATADDAITLESGAVAAPRWSDGGLVCSLYGPNTSMLSAPNFTVNPPAIIDIRPWVAFYTAANGWRWLGTGGLNRSAWYRGTATPTGVMQWRSPAGALNRFTWAPISFHPSSTTYAIGVFEVVYWYTQMRYVWEYTSSFTSSGAKTTYCSYS